MGSTVSLRRLRGGWLLQDLGRLSEDRANAAAEVRLGDVGDRSNRADVQGLGVGAIPRVEGT